MQSSIHIVTEKPELDDIYLVKILARFWKDWGHEVSFGPTKSPLSNVGFMHLDSTRIEPEQVPAMDGAMINRHVLDISKSIYSTERVYPDSDWDGPVIIKSNLNFYGTPEWYSTKRTYRKKLQRYLANRCWQIARMLPSNNYPILPSISKVPGWVWKKQDLIVERFLPDMEDGLYSIRGWIFLGDRGYCYRFFSPYPVVKAKDMVRREILEHTPPALVGFREKYQFDYGKFDFVEVDGKAILIDMNKTPTSRIDPNSPLLPMLAEGIYSFCQKKE